MHVCMHACMDGWMYEYMRKPQSSLNHNDAKAVPEDKHMQKILRELDDGAKGHTYKIHTYIHTCMHTDVYIVLMYAHGFSCGHLT